MEPWHSPNFVPRNNVWVPMVCYEKYLRWNLSLKVVPRRTNVCSYLFSFSLECSIRLTYSCLIHLFFITFLCIDSLIYLNNLSTAYYVYCWWCRIAEVFCLYDQAKMKMNILFTSWIFVLNIRRDQRENHILATTRLYDVLILYQSKEIEGGRR